MASKKMLSGSSNKPRSLTSIERRLVNFLATLPSDELKLLIKSEEVAEMWIDLRQANSFISICFEARFSGADDPLAYMHNNNGKEGKLCRNWIWACVDYYKAVWGLLQVSFRTIKEECDKIGADLIFVSAFDLLLELVTTGVNNEFITKCLPYYKTSVPDVHLALKLFFKAMGYRASSVELKLTPKEQAILERIVRQEPKEVWFQIVLKVCEQAGKRDLLIANKLKDVYLQAGRRATAQQRIIEADRKGRIPLKLESYEMRNQKQLIANRHGGTYSLNKTS